MRTLEESDRLRNGLKGIIILLLVIGVGQSFASVPMLFATPSYYAQFYDSGGIKAGGKVRIAGGDLGLVRSPPSSGGKVRAGCALGRGQGGTASRAASPTDAPRGRDGMPHQP